MEGGGKRDFDLADLTVENCKEELDFSVVLGVHFAELVISVLW